MFKRLAAISTTLTASFAVIAGTTAAAQEVPIENAAVVTYFSTAELGTGAMTSSAEVAGYGAPDQEHPSFVQQDNYGRVGGGLNVEGGQMYRVTVTLENAYAEERATGSAEARGFASVELYDCCFAGEATRLAGGEGELPATPGEVEVSLDVFMSDAGSLNADIELHSYVKSYVDTVDTASVRASVGTTRIDITPLDDAGQPTNPTPPTDPAEPPPPPTPTEPTSPTTPTEPTHPTETTRAPTCVLIICL